MTTSHKGLADRVLGIVAELQHPDFTFSAEEVCDQHFDLCVFCRGKETGCLGRPVLVRTDEEAAQIVGKVYRALRLHAEFHLGAQLLYRGWPVDFPGETNEFHEPDLPTAALPPPLGLIGENGESGNEY